MLLYFMFFAVHSASASEVESIFNDYFDEELKVVEVPQDLAVRSCVNNSSLLVSKLDDAYNTCFGSDDEDKDSDYDWNDFEKNSAGHDSDNDGLSDEFEANEACFYEQMGWIKGRKVNERTILNDFKDLKDIDLYTDFQKEIRSCSRWNGDFKRRKREASWSISLARNRRESTKRVKKENKGKGSKNQGIKKNNRNGKQPNVGGKGNNKKGLQNMGVRKNDNSENSKRRPGKGTKNISNRKEKKGKKKDLEQKNKGKKNKKFQRGESMNNNERKGRKMNGNKWRRNNEGKTKGTKNTEKKNGKKKEKKNERKNVKKTEKKKEKKQEKKNEEKKERNDKNKTTVSRKERKLMRELLPENIYNQLWCFEVTVEKVLQSCVERKLMEDVEETLEVTDQTMGYSTYSTEYMYQ